MTSDEPRHVAGLPEEVLNRYAAFISYRHLPADRRWAKWLHSSLENYRVPRRLVRDLGLPRRMGRIFRDEEELPASSDLSAQIEEALRLSRYLIVVCSPRTPESEWVNREIVRFRETGRGERILALLIEGEPGEAFPVSLREIRHRVVSASGLTHEEVEATEPLAADVRPRPNESARRLRETARLRLLAAVLGCRFDDLRQREQERSVRRLGLVGAGLAILAAVLGLMAVVALSLRDEADRQRVRAETAWKQAEQSRAAEAEQRGRAVRALTESLGRLAEASFGQMDYQSVLDAVRQQRELDPNATLSSEMQRTLRAAVWMTPEIRRMRTGVAGATHVVPVSTNEVIVVGRDEVCRYDVTAEVVRGRLPPPGDKDAPSVVARGRNGALWLAVGSTIHVWRPESNGWRTVVNLSELVFRAANLTTNAASRADDVTWMAGQGHTLAISGLAVDESGRFAAVTLADCVLCWVDFERGECTRWWCDRQHGGSVSRDLPASDGPTLVMAPGTEWLAWRREYENRSRVNVFHLPDLRKASEYYHRGISLAGIHADRDALRLWVLASDGMIFAPTYEHFFEVEHGGMEEMPEHHRPRTLPLNRLRMVCFEPAGQRFAAISEDGQLLVSPTRQGADYELVRRLPPRVWRACAFGDDGNVLALTADGDLHSFDGRMFGVRRIAFGEKIRDVRQTSDPSRFVVRTERAAIWDREVAAARVFDGSGRGSLEPLVRIPADHAFCTDPDVRYVAIALNGSGEVHGTAERRIVHRFSGCGYPGSITFSPDGEYLIYGGGWGFGVTAMRTGVWTNAYKHDSGAVGVLADTCGSAAGWVLLSNHAGRSLTCLDSATWRPVWESRTHMGALGPFIPVGDCPPDRDYWVKLWSGEFLKFDGATGKRLSERRLQRWANSGARDFQTVNGGDLVAFATFGGTLQICWLHDMDAIFDSRVIGPKTGPMSLNGDGSAVAMVTDDKLLLIETGRWRRNAQLRRNASEILGLDLGAVRRPSAYVAPQGDERTTVVAMDRADPRTRCLVQSGLAATWSSDELAALRDGEGRLVIVDATPEVLARLANEIGTVRRFAERGGWLVLWGVTPEGLSAFNRLVGVEHLLRKYEPCLVTLGAEMHVAVVGLDNDDVGMNDGRRFSSPNPRQRRPAGDAFSWLVDLDDIAPFCKWPDPAYWRKEPGSARLWRFGWPMSMVDGMSGDYGRRTDFLIDLDRDEPTAWEIVLPRREVIEGFSIACNFGGLPLKSVALTFEPGSVRREFRLADTYLRQDFVIPDGGVPADRVQIQLLGVEKAEGRQNQLFVGNIWIRVRRDESFTTRVKPLLNVGGLVAYPMAKGGILLNQYRIVEREQNPLNALRKRVLMRKILTNLGARFDAENAASPGP